MDLGVFYEVIMPLLEMEGAALICISTTLGEYNFYSQLTELRDGEGKKIMNVIHIELVCDECKKKKGVINCPHNAHKTPKWKSGSRRKKIRWMYVGREAMFERESLGRSSNDENLAFEPHHVKDFNNREPFKPNPNSPPKYVYIACDPNAGGPSHMAIVSGFFERGTLVVRNVVSFIFVVIFAWQLHRCFRLQKPPCASSSTPRHTA